MRWLNHWLSYGMKAYVKDECFKIKSSDWLAGKQVGAFIDGFDDLSV